MRQAKQILALPYKKDKNNQYLYAIFKRVGIKERWQGLAGGVEDKETYLKACIREIKEEANISNNAEIIKLKSISTIPVVNITKKLIFKEETLLVTEKCFGVDVTNEEIILSKEHTTYEWLTYEKAISKLTWESNKNALWELNYILTKRR